MLSFTRGSFFFVKKRRFLVKFMTGTFFIEISLFFLFKRFLIKTVKERFLILWEGEVKKKLEVS